MTMLARSESSESFPEFSITRHVHHPSFSLPATQNTLWGPDSRHVAIPRYNLLPEIGEAELSDGVKPSPLTIEDERLLFLRYNYAKYRLGQLLQAAEDEPAAAPAADVDLWRGRVYAVREQITHANLPLVPAMAKRVTISGVEFKDLVAEGYVAVLRSIEKFDVQRGYKFSTYACRSILASFYRLGESLRVYRKHFPAQFDPELEKSDYGARRSRRQREDAVDAVRQVLRKNSARLTAMEREVIGWRFPLVGEDVPLTLLQVSEKVKLSYERVRQLERKSLAKLQSAVEQRLWRTDRA